MSSRHIGQMLFMLGLGLAMFSMLVYASEYSSSGSAGNGYVADGHYFLGEHGRYTEVSAESWHRSLRADQRMNRFAGGGMLLALVGAVLAHLSKQKPDDKASSAEAPSGLVFSVGADSASVRVPSVDSRYGKTRSGRILLTLAWMAGAAVCWFFIKSMGAAIATATGISAILMAAVGLQQLIRTVAERKLTITCDGVTLSYSAAGMCWMAASEQGPLMKVGAAYDGQLWRVELEFRHERTFTVQLRVSREQLTEFLDELCGLCQELINPRCVKCDYALAGLRDAVCPECGADLAAAGVFVGGGATNLPPVVTVKDRGPPTRVG